MLHYVFVFFKTLGDSGENVEKVKTAAVMTTGLKSMCTLASLDGIDDLRKCCDGHGFLKASVMADLVSLELYFLLSFRTFL